ncbi:MAG: choice-of-anchor L domain-containing protein [Chitinophagales bacterium]|jgi:hypothetical protein|nr:choice-of-anchor L domain-containing protein [Chitinophagales bacterium]
MKTKFFTCLCLLLAQFGAKAQLFIDNSFTVQEMVTDFFGANSCVQVSNITSNTGASMGFFDGSATNLGVNAGILLTSGKTTNAIGPNNSGAISESLNTSGDPDLESLIPTFPTNDASVLEMDIVSLEDTIVFEYVFGSEEYLEWVGSSFNDVFGFFISGSGIDGVQNIALIPNTDIPVSINNVNDVTNSTYYVDNGDGNTAPQNADDFYVQYDGLTTVLTATAIVTPGETYHIKIAVADAGDSALDSGVFLSTASLCGNSNLQVISGFEVPSINGNTVTVHNEARYGTAWHWDFGDGTTSDLRNPGSHTYLQNGTYTITLTTSNYCSQVRSEQVVVIGEATGIGQNIAQYAIYPNPSDGNLNVQLPQVANLSLYDATGRMLENLNAQQHRFDLQQYGKGVYILRLTTTDGQTYTEKIVY